MAEYRIFRVRDVEPLMDKLVEKIFDHFRMDRQFVIAARKFCNRPFAANDGECRNAVHGERFQVIATKKHHGIGFGVVQDFSKLTHSRDARVEHLRILVGWPDHQLRRMNGTECGDNFAHKIPPA